AADRFRVETEAMLERWLRVARASRQHAEWYGTGIASLADAVWAEGRWFEVPSLSRWIELIGDAAPRNGVVRLTEPASELSDAALWPAGQGGRVVILVPGAVRVADLTAVAHRRLVTVIASGPITVAGTVEANLVARDGIRFE